MIIPDANLLLYAYDASSLFHQRSRSWLEALFSGEESVGLSPCVLFSFVRLSTHSRIFAHPLRIEEAAEIVREWIALPITRVLEITPDDCLQALKLLEKIGAGGNLTTDAQIAASARRWNATVETADTDFARFGIKWRNPLHSKSLQ